MKKAVLYAFMEEYETDTKESLICECVLENIKSFLPNNWKKVVFRAYYDEDSYDMKYYVKTPSGYKDCFKFASADQHISAFDEIDKLLKSIRSKLSNKNRWSVVTVIIEKNGKFKVNYEYDDLSDSFVTLYMNKWKKEYLKEEYFNMNTFEQAFMEGYLDAINEIEG